MCAELGPLAFIQGPFKERSHDARLNELPIGFGGFAQNPKLFLVEFKDTRIIEQVPVEMPNFVLTKTAARGHDFKQLFQGLGKVLRVIGGRFQDFAKEVFRQKPRVFGKHAEHNAIEKPGDAQDFSVARNSFLPGSWHRPVRRSPFFEATWRPRRFFGPGFGNGSGRSLRFEEFRVVKQSAENAKVFRAVDLVVGKFVNLLNRAVEIRLDDVAVKIANHQQRRIEQRFTVTEKLFVSLVQVFLFAFVFPGKTVLFPHIGKTAFRGFAGVGRFVRVKSSASLTTRFWKQKKSLPDGSASAGVCWPSRRQRSSKCPW